MGRCELLDQSQVPGGETEERSLLLTRGVRGGKETPSTIHFPRVSSILNKAMFRLRSHPNDQAPAPRPFLSPPRNKFTLSLYLDYYRNVEQVQ